MLLSLLNICLEWARSLIQWHCAMHRTMRVTTTTTIAFACGTLERIPCGLPPQDPPSLCCNSREILRRSGWNSLIVWHWHYTKLSASFDAFGAAIKTRERRIRWTSPALYSRDGNGPDNCNNLCVRIPIHSNWECLHWSLRSPISTFTLSDNCSRAYQGSILVQGDPKFCPLCLYCKEYIVIDFKHWQSINLKLNSWCSKPFFILLPIHCFRQKVKILHRFCIFVFME